MQTSSTILTHLISSSGSDNKDQDKEQETFTIQPHQQPLVDEARNFILKNPNKPYRKLIYHPTGSGKTSTTLFIARELGAPIVVVAPVSVLKSFEQTIKSIPNLPPVILTTYSGLKDLPISTEDDKQPLTWIVDEAHNIRNTSSQRWIQFSSRLRPNHHVILSTATPVINQPEEFANLMQVLTGEKFTTTGFHRRFLTPDFSHLPWYKRYVRKFMYEFLPWKKYDPIPGRHEFLNLIRGKIDYYPPTTYGVDLVITDKEVPLSNEQLLINKAILGSLPPWFRWKLQDVSKLSYSDLRRMAAFLTGPREASLSIYPFMPTPDLDYAFRTSTKLQQAFKDIVDGLKKYETGGIIVYSNYLKAGLLPLAYALEQHKIPYHIIHGGLSAEERQKIVDDYNQGRVRVVLIGPAASEGVNFLRTRQLLLLDSVWNPARLYQIIGRSVRRTSHIDLPEEERRVHVIRYISTIPTRFYHKFLSWILGRTPSLSSDEMMNIILSEKERRLVAFDKLLQRASKYKQAAAKGIPDFRVFGDLTKLPTNKLVQFVVQYHKARKAGPHYDIRLGTPDTDLYSWVTRKGLPEPGEKYLAIRQPLHSFSYGRFQGKIHKGYGSGEVKLIKYDKVFITKVTPDAVYFTTAYGKQPERFVLFKDKGTKWYIFNITDTKPLEYGKGKFVEIPAEQAEYILDKLKEGSEVQAKIDGAAALVNILKNRFDVLSYRISTTGRPIIHTERMGLSPYREIPKELSNSILRGEIYAENEKGEVLPPQQLGGFLNAALGKSLEDQALHKAKLKTLLFDIYKYHNKLIDPETVPYQKRKELLKKFIDVLPKDRFVIAEGAKTIDEAKELWNTIRSGKHPQTTEGIVVHQPLGSPIKIKIRNEYDVWIKDIFRGTGKYQNSAGGFIYSLTPDGPPIGRVGTGLSDELRKDMWLNKEWYIGRRARISAQGQFPSGAYRAPSLIAIHEDYPTKESK